MTKLEGTRRPSLRRFNPWEDQSIGPHLYHACSITASPSPWVEDGLRPAPEGISGPDGACGSHDWEEQWAQLSGWKCRLEDSFRGGLTHFAARNPTSPPPGPSQSAPPPGPVQTTSTHRSVGLPSRFFLAETFVVVGPRGGDASCAGLLDFRALWTTCSAEVAATSHYYIHA